MFMLKESYVYIYLDPRKKGEYIFKNEFYSLKFENEPFYIGKGIADRCKQGIKISLRKRGRCLKSNKIKSIHFDNEEIIIQKIYENLSNEEANVHEINLIKLIGKKIDNCGPLTNICPGGEGGGAKHTTEWKQKLSKKVIQYDLNNIEIKRFDSIKKAAKELNIVSGQISKVCKHLPKYNTAGGFKWEFENPKHIEQFYPNTETVPNFNRKHSATTIKKLKKPKKWKTSTGSHPLKGKRMKSKYPPILQFDLENNLIKEWSSITELYRTTNYNFGFLMTVLKNNKGTAYGFKWKFKT